MKYAVLLAVLVLFLPGLEALVVNSQLADGIMEEWFDELNTERQSVQDAVEEV